MWLSRKGITSLAFITYRTYAKLDFYHKAYKDLHYKIFLIFVCFLLFVAEYC